MSSFRPEPLTCDLSLLAAALVELQRTWRMASHEIGDGAVPAGCDDDTVVWWRHAYQVWQRRERERALF